MMQADTGEDGARAREGEIMLTKRTLRFPKNSPKVKKVVGLTEGL